MAIKKCVALQLGITYDSQTTNRKQGGLPARTHTTSGALLLVAWESYMTPTQPEYKKIPPETGLCCYFLIEKSPETMFLVIKTFNKI
jgi:hypothetical protein